MSRKQKHDQLISFLGHLQEAKQVPRKKDEAIDEKKIAYSRKEVVVLLAVMAVMVMGGVATYMNWERVTVGCGIVGAGVGMWTRKGW